MGERPALHAEPLDMCIHEPVASLMLSCSKSWFGFGYAKPPPLHVPPPSPWPFRGRFAFSQPSVIVPPND
jgi:hypothetical protein